MHTHVHMHMHVHGHVHVHVRTKGQFEAGGMSARRTAVRAAGLCTQVSRTWQYHHRHRFETPHVYAYARVHMHVVSCDMMVLACHLVGLAVIEQRVLGRDRSCHLCHARTAWVAEWKLSWEQHGHVGATRHSGRAKEDAQEDAQELHGRTQRPCACVLLLARRGAAAR